MTQPAIIREYQSEDEYEVLNLFRLNTPKYFAIEEEGDLKRYLNSEIEFYYVLLFKGQMIGCGGINFSADKKTAFISWDIIHPEYQGRSFGSQLLQHRINKIHAMSRIQEIVVRTSQFAFKFYEKQGFKLVQKVNDYWAEGFHMYKMKYIE